MGGIFIVWVKKYVNYCAWSNYNTLSIVSTFGENYKNVILGYKSVSQVKAKFICFDGAIRGSKVISATMISCNFSREDDEVYKTKDK